MASIPDQVPPTVRQGDTIRWTRAFADYPASAGWQLSYTLVSATARITINATADGDGFDITVPASTSAGWGGADYTWQEVVSNGTERYTLGTGSITVQADLTAGTGGVDLRTHAQKVLAAIEAVIEGQAGAPEAETQVEGRALKYWPYADLLLLRDRYLREVAAQKAAERAAAGLGSSRIVRVRFG